MKNFFLALLAVSLSVSPSHAERETEAFDAVIKFEKRGIDLGQVSRQHPDLDFSFIGVNNGDAPLVLTYVHPSCSCVRLLYPREPIAPGDSLRIRGVFNPHGLSDGPFRRDIIVRSNATEPKIRLVITGTIVPDSILVSSAD